MNDIVGMQGLIGQAQANAQRQQMLPAHNAQPKSVYEEAAFRWKLAAERLDLARKALESARDELDKAGQQEADAWSELETAAGRGPQPEAVVYRSMP